MTQIHTAEETLIALGLVLPQLPAPAGNYVSAKRVGTVPGFANSPAVINGAFDLPASVFGEAGRHVRAALGVSALPRKALVELQMTVRVKEP